MEQMNRLTGMGLSRISSRVELWNKRSRHTGMDGGYIFRGVTTNLGKELSRVFQEGHAGLKLSFYY